MNVQVRPYRDIPVARPRGARNISGAPRTAPGPLVRALALSLCLFAAHSNAAADRLLVPMDLRQANHLKAYGLAYWALQHNIEVEWLLNYRGGAFMMEYVESAAGEGRLRDVDFERIDGAEAVRIYAEIEQGNMNAVRLEKAPKIAVYSPPNKQPWDDAVTLALSYAEIPYDILWDEEVLAGKLSEYDWLHLHHEDFTGQYGKFYRSHGRELWYRRQQAQYESLANRLGFRTVSEEKGAVARAILDYISSGGFVFAMCSATDTFDIALAATGVDIVDTVYDGDPPDPDAQARLDYSRTIAFEDFSLITDPMEYEHADIDVSPTTGAQLRGPDADAFTLFEFSAKFDPVPAMLTQNHVPVVRGFLGQTTAFRRSRIRKSVTIMGEVSGTDQIKYIHGNVGRGTFTFYAGHDPEDYRHFVGDPPTELALHRNSPGYRLILNNILFPAARKQKRKT